jgi:hypothetical protein
MPTFSNTTNIKPSVINGYKSTELSKKNNFNVAATNFLAILSANKKFLPAAWANEKLNIVQGWVRTPPKYVVSVKESNYRTRTTQYEYDCRVWHKWFKRKRWCRTGWNYYTTYVWTVDLNNNFNNTILTQIANMQQWITNMYALMFNNCSNPNTLLNTDGLRQCGYKNTVDESQSLAAEKLNISQNTLGQIQNTDDYPQYSGAVKSNNLIASYDNWNFTDKINSQYPNYNYQYGNLQNLITTRNNYLNKSYDDCSVPVSLTSIDSSGNPVASCVSNPYNGALKECNMAYQMAQQYQYGSDKLFDLWTDVSNSIPGNTIGANKTILSNASGSCQKWVEMFNQWQKSEDAAIAAPCLPERPITSKSDDTINDIVTNFEDVSKKRIDTLNGRLQNLKDKLKNYPNILQLKKENILDTSYGMEPSVVVKNYKTDIGIIPIQYLEMIIPGGMNGPIGEMGTTGGQGLTGSSGPIGKEGPIGNPDVPF